MPGFLITNLEVSQRLKQGSGLASDAQQRFQLGRRYYQARDFSTARKEFDAAVDLLLQASKEDPTGRARYQAELDSMVDAIHRFDLAGLGASADLEDNQFDKAPLEDILEMTFPVDPKLKDKVRAQVAATVSQLPLSVNDAVLGYIHFFSTRGHKTLIAGLERSGRYRPMIQRIFDEEGLPIDLIRLAQAESGFIPRAMSRKAAGGMWQFLVERGRQYGLSRTAYLDERMDPEKATRAAARHLRDLYDEFGDWYLAIAAYNCGPVAVERAVERTGYADFWELRRRRVLPMETTNYVPIILAMTIMEKNAAEYGLEDIVPEQPLAYDTVEIAAATSLSLLSDIVDVPVTEIAALNPALLKRAIPAGYAVHVPKGLGNRVIAALQLVPPEYRADWRMHRVGYGENLKTISALYGAKSDSILGANRLADEDVTEGDCLLIPLAPKPEPAVRRTPAKRSAARKTVAKRSTVQKKPAAATHSKPRPGVRVASR